ncbi:S9 family peptidase [Pontibacter pamirensis]|uniref:S9 family peptidase n=1 Tax=Pontibacter pamirensis TaxID=2562824 RepID=UPI001389A5DF|nr:prolyl oligopeptidase family serine peptidase [Pontibacter pamirensis]
MKRYIIYCFLIAFAFLLQDMPLQAQGFALEAVRSYPFPSGLTASEQGSRIAWVFDEQGRRNVYVAEGPAFTPRKLTNYTLDDGQEITSLSLSADGQWVVYVRGGEHGAIWDEGETVNPLSDPVPPKVELWSMPFAGGEPRALAEGDEPVISPNSDRVAFIRNGQVWEALLKKTAAAKPLFRARGSISSLEWSPDGKKLAFVSNRGSHAFVGIYTDSNTPIKWMAPSFYKDTSPRWSPDGKRIVFVRTPGTGGAPEAYLEKHHRPWAIWMADVASGEATQLWKAPETLPGSVPNTHGGYNLHWAAQNRIVFLSYHDGWPHLYSMPAAGGEPLLLTKGEFMAEHISLSQDGKWLLFSANTGPEKADIDRRHVARVPVDKPAMELLTPGDGLEWSPVLTGDGATVALITATAQRPPLPSVMSFDKGKVKVLAQDLIPASFPQKQLVTPQQVTYKAPDGFTIHAQLFEPKGGAAKKPAIVYVHGGPSRQMLLGWHYSDYYANAYAMNQYLTNLGFVVLSVNYRLGIGYGYAFQQPEKAGLAGASEYQDIRAAATWLAKQPQVDASRIGIYGGSYGGYLTALALGRDSDLFAAGVDIHGMSDRSLGRITELVAPDRYERAPDADLAAKVIWESSPASSVGTWKSPVLLIHGDDDRNVSFSRSIDMVRRLEAKGVPFETLVLVDDTHHWMLFSNALKAGNATADFFQRKLLRKGIGQR